MANIRWASVLTSSTYVCGGAGEGVERSRLYTRLCEGWPVGAVHTCGGVLSGRGRLQVRRPSTWPPVRVTRHAVSPSSVTSLGCTYVGGGWPVEVAVLSGRGQLQVRRPSTWPPVRVTRRAAAPSLDTSWGCTYVGGGVEWSGSATGQTPLHLAASQGHKACCLALIGHQLGLYVRGGGGGVLTSRGWIVDESGSATGQTPLHLAASQGHKACCLSLIGHQLGLYVRGGGGGLTSRGWGVERSGSATGQTPLHLAASQGHKACCLSLIGHQLGLYVRGGGGGLTSRGWGVERSGSATGQTPLHLAASQGHKACCRALTGHQLGLYVRGGGCWVVGVGYRSDAPPPGRQSGSQGVLPRPHRSPVGVVRTWGGGGVLTSRGWIVDESGSATGQTPLHLAASQGHKACCLSLIGHQLGLYVRGGGGGWPVGVGVLSGRGRLQVRRPSTWPPVRVTRRAVSPSSVTSWGCTYVGGGGGWPVGVGVLSGRGRLQVRRPSTWPPVRVTRRAVSPSSVTSWGCTYVGGGGGWPVGVGVLSGRGRLQVRRPSTWPPVRVTRRAVSPSSVTSWGCTYVGGGGGWPVGVGVLSGRGRLQVRRPSTWPPVRVTRRAVSPSSVTMPRSPSTTTSPRPRPSTSPVRTN